MSTSTRDSVGRLVGRRLLPPGQVSVVRMYGPISGGVRAADWIELLRRLRRSGRVPAVVLDIDSPGGSATASDDMYLAVRRLAEHKPVVAAIRGVGASGGYLVAMGAHRVVANPNAVVGSIGVISAGPRVRVLLERIGVRVSETKAGRLKGVGAPWRDETPEEQGKEQELVDALYGAFIERVATGRRMEPERVRELATGEVWLGRQAVELGLVDEIGDLERAIEIAAGLAGVPARGAPVRFRRSIIDRVIDRLAGASATAMADTIAARLDERYRF